MTEHRLIATPSGLMAIIAEPDGRLALRWIEGAGDAALSESRERPDLLPDLADRLHRYFAGEHVAFDDVPTPSGPPFFRLCWDACRRIPRGETRSYAELAAMAGGGRAAARAAGQAMRRNPLPIVVPCHRVRGAAGDLGGFAGSRTKDGPEMSRKQYLLALEGALPLNGG